MGHGMQHNFLGHIYALLCTQIHPGIAFLSSTSPCPLEPKQDKILGAGDTWMESVLGKKKRPRTISGWNPNIDNAWGHRLAKVWCQGWVQALPVVPSSAEESGKEKQSPQDTTRWLQNYPFGEATFFLLRFLKDTFLSLSKLCLSRFFNCHLKC